MLLSKANGRPMLCSTPIYPAGVENAFYEGPLRLRLPVAMQLDPDGAFSFELPLPSPEGGLGKVRGSLTQPRAVLWPLLLLQYHLGRAVCRPMCRNAS
jgi:hypothetical protein